MKLKITKCSDKDFWYKNHIGETYDILITDYRINQHVIKESLFGLFGGKSVGFDDCEIF